MQPSKGPRIYPRWRSKHLALTCSPPFFLPCLCSASGEDSRPEFIPLWVYFRIVETRIVVCVPSRVSATFSVARSRLCSTLNFRRVNRSFLFPSIHQFQVSFSRSTSEKRSRVSLKRRQLTFNDICSTKHFYIHYIATNFSPDIYKTVAKWPTNDTLDGGSERERRKLGEPISIRRAATPSLPRFRPTTQFRNFTRLRCSIDKLFRACCTRAGACAFQRGVHCRCTHPRLTPFLFIFQ